MLKKKFLKTKCKVEFSVPDQIADKANRVSLVGEFNDWDEHATPMQRKGSTFTIILDLELNREYQFRYLVDDLDWHNDWHADGYIQNPFWGDNSIVATFPQ